MKKIVSIFLALCLMVLSMPFIGGSVARAEDLPTPTIVFDQTEYNLQEDLGHYRITLEKPVDGYWDFRCWVNFIGRNGENIWGREYSDGDFHEEDGKWVMDENQDNEHPYYTAVLSGETTARVDYEYKYEKVNPEDENDRWEEYCCSSFGKAIFTVRKGGALGELTIDTDNADTYAGRPLKLNFSFTGDVDRWEDDNNTPIDPRVEYSIVKKETNEDVGIAPRSAQVYTAKLWNDGPREGDPEDSRRYSSGWQVTQALEAGTYVVTAKPFDKRGNHDDGQTVTKEITVPQAPFSGVTITTDKEFYRVGEKATITVHHAQATTFGMDVWAPDEKGWQQLDNVAATNGSYTFATGVLLNPWSSDVGCHVYAVNDNEVNVEIHRGVWNPETVLTADKDEYIAGETAKLSLSCYKGKKFRIYVDYYREDGTRDGENIDVEADSNGTATYNLYMGEKQIIYVNADAWYEVPGSEDYAQADGSNRLTLNVIEAAEQPIEVGKPTGLTATNNAGAVLAWTAGANAQAYEIEKKVDNGAYALLTTTEALTYTDSTAVEKGKVYAYRVTATAKNGAGEEFRSAVSDEVRFEIPAAPAIELAAPTEVKAAAATTGGATVTWKASEGAQEYQVDRKEEGGEYATLATVADITYTDATATDKEKVYYYRITAKAKNADGVEFKSPVSNDVKFAIPKADPIDLAAPTGITVTATEGKAVISWTAVTNAQKITIARQSGTGVYDKIAEVTEGTTYTDATVAKDTQYSYRLTASAKNADGVEFVSPASADIFFKIESAPLVAPDAPKSLKPSSADGTSITLKWKVGEGVKKCTVYRAEEKVDENGDPEELEFTKIADVTEDGIADGAGTYTDKDIKVNTLYVYRVTATLANADGVETVSPSSAGRAYMILPKPAKKATLKSTKAKTLDINWKAVKGATSYEVYYSTSKTAPKFTDKATKKASALKLTVKKLKSKKTYYVYIRAVRTLDSGVIVRGPWSAAAKLKIK